MTPTSLNNYVLRISWAIALAGVCSSFLQADEAADTQLNEGNSASDKPSMRPVDRDWAYFSLVACSDVNKLVFHSRSEEILVAKRKSQCMNKYRAFLPKPL